MKTRITILIIWLLVGLAGTGWAWRDDSITIIPKPSSPWGQEYEIRRDLTGTNRDYQPGGAYNPYITEVNPFGETRIRPQYSPDAFGLGRDTEPDPYYQGRRNR